LDGGGQSAFDHRECGLDLPALPVAAIGLGQTLLHASAMASARQLVGGTAVRGREERGDAVDFAGITMIGLRVVSGVADGSLRPDGLQRGVEQGHEAIDVDARAATGQNADDEMTLAVDAQFQLGVTAVSDGFPGLIGAAASADEIAAGVAAVEAAGVEGDAAAAPAAAEEAPHRAAEHASRMGLPQQPMRGLLQGGEVRNALQPQGSP
jgi:hypothetical protein